MNPDQQFQSSPFEPPTSSFNFISDHDHHHKQTQSGDKHRGSRKKIHQHPSYAKADTVYNKEGEENETGHNMEAAKTIDPLTTTAAATMYVITMPSCPSSSSVSTSAYSSPSSVNIPPSNTFARHHRSNEGQASTSPSAEADEFYAKKFCMASTLIVSYLIEVTVQVLLIIQCFRFFHLQLRQSSPLDLVTNPTAVTSSSLSSWFWFLVISSVLSSFLVTLISIIWVFRGMDFSGRHCGRLLCYVMHSFLLGLLWRYLKLAFAYDRADIEEFFKLKTIQTYVQSLPLVTIHLAWVLTTQQESQSLLSSPHIVDSYHVLSSWLVVAEMLSAVMSLLILSSSTVSFFSTFKNSNSSNNNNLHGVVAGVARPSYKKSGSATPTSPGDNSNTSNQCSRDCGGTKLKVEIDEGDNNPNHHFNDSGTASSVDNQGAAADKNDIEEESSCSSASSVWRFLTTVVKWMMSHYSQKCEPGRALLLVSRVISLGMLVYKMNYYWTGFITLLHFGVSFIWLAGWTVVSNGKSNDSVKPALGSSSAAAFSGANDSNDTCDSRSNGGSSDDSGLVVKSEVLLENAAPVVITPDNEEKESDVGAGGVNVDNDSNGEGQKRVDYGVKVEGTRGGGNGYRIKNTTKTNHVNLLGSPPGGFASCFSVIVHRRNNAGNENNKNISSNTGKVSQGKRENQRQVFMRVLPLTCVLFWDLSNSPPAFQLSEGARTARNSLNPWATALPVLLTMAENICITINHHIRLSDEPNMRYLTMSSAACLFLGWLFIAVYQFRWRSNRHRRELRKRMSDDDEDDDADSGYGKNKRSSCISGGDSGSSKACGKNVNKKGTSECLSLCCSSLSHPLNIKRKGHRDQQDIHYICKDGPIDKLSSAEHQHQLQDVTTAVKYNEYQEQQELGKVVNAHSQRHYNLSHNTSNHTDAIGQSNPNRSIIPQKRKGVPKKSTILPDPGIPTHHTTSVPNIALEGDAYQDSNDNRKISSIKPELRQRYCESEEMTMACGTTGPTTTPVTNNNYTNIKEALTRRISNKSCANGSLKKPHHHHHHHHHHQSNNQISQDHESVKGDGEVGTEEGETGAVISSSTRVHQQQQRQHQHQATTTNSNKCMPISIKSPISWLPETCCNDSSGSAGSSNSRNTNTLAMHESARIPSENRLLYCPDKYIDLGNNNTAHQEEAEESKRTCRKQQQPRKQLLQQHHYNQNPENEGNSDFSIVFFEGRAGGGTSRSYNQKQCRTSAASNVQLLRAARSANTTPVASSKPFPLDIQVTALTTTSQHRNHPHFQPSTHHHHQQQEQLQYHQYTSYDDDEVDPIERVTKESGASATHRRIRNQITGKTYLSDGASLTSLDGVFEIRASTPVEIKKASRVIVNYPPPHHQISDSKTVSRCLCKVDRTPSPDGGKHNRQSGRLSPLLLNSGENGDHEHLRVGRNSNNNNIYEKLIDDSYGILICEGEHTPRQNSVNRKSCNSRSKSKCIDSSSNNDPHNYHHPRLSDASELRRTAGGGGGSQKLRILCAKCLENHDPLLTNCVDPLKIVDDDHLPELISHYNPANINSLKSVLKWQDEQSQHQQKCLNQLVSRSPYLCAPADSDTTDYPSDTEFTTNNNPVEDDGQSLSTHFSSATYTWHQHHQQQLQHNYHHHHHTNQNQQPKPTQLSQFIWAASTMVPTSSTLGGCEDGGVGSSQQDCPKEFTGLEYVRTWLMASHPRTFAVNNISHNNNNSNGSGCNNTHQHPLYHHHHPQQQQQQHQLQEKDSRKTGNKYSNSNGSLRKYAARHQGNDKGLTMTLLSSAPTSKSSNHVSFKNKSACDKTISKKKRLRQLEKRQRPVGRGASPPAKELYTSNNSSSGNADVLNSANATNAACINNMVPTITSNVTTVGDDCGGVVDIGVSARFQPPPSRKQHPLLFYDMIPRQEQLKPLTATTTSHKKCRDQLDLFHKELETVV